MDLFDISKFVSIDIGLLPHLDLGCFKSNRDYTFLKFTLGNGNRQMNPNHKSL